MSYLLPTFKAVSVIFACASVFTGAQALLDPIGFSHSFGIPVPIKKNDPKSKISPQRSSEVNSTPAVPYISLMGIRQLATGVTLLVFGYQNKWQESATILSLLGIIVACTDGYILARSGNSKQAMFHAIPGSLIALLAGTVVFTDA